MEIYERDGLLHGKFVLFYDEPPAGGIDVKNPDPALRARPLLGADFILNFAFDRKKWKKDRIYNPDSGKLYKADLELQDGVLKVRGLMGMRLLGRADSLNSALGCSTLLRPRSAQDERQAVVAFVTRMFIQLVR